MLPAARLGDMHTCPMLTEAGSPHTGGPILMGAANVLVAGQPAACLGDTCTCAAPQPDAIMKGSATVLIAGRPAARVGDSTAHGGVVTVGAMNVLIGG